MKLTAACLLAALLCACAQTDLSFYDRQGRLAAHAHIQGDATNITITTRDGASFHADTLTHSTATVAGSKVIGATTSYAGGLATILRIILPFLP